MTTNTVSDRHIFVYLSGSWEIKMVVICEIKGKL